MMRRLSLIVLFLTITALFLSQTAIAAVSPVVTPVDFYSIPYSAPERIAADSEGRLYVSDSSAGLVHVFSNNGAFLYSINSVEIPVGVAVDKSGRIYISDIKNSNVGVYDSSGSLLFKLGSGDGEFGLANDIDVSAAGNVYVTDSKNNIVRVYSPSGAPLLSFGSGLLKFPTGIVIDEGAGEVFVIDHNNIYIRVYDLNGNLKRSIRGSGGMMGGGKLLRPLGLAVDSTRLYITDAFHSVVAVYDKSSGVFLNYIGKYGSGHGEFKTPTDLVLDGDGKLFVTNTNNQRIEVLGIDTYTGIEIEPDTVYFSTIANGSIVTQSVKLTSSGSDTAWTASSSDSWILLSQASGSTPAAVDLTVNPFGLAAGYYKSEITFKTPSGTEYVLPVYTEVKAVAPSLSVSPSSMSFVYQKKSDTMPSGSLMISSNGPILSWNAMTTVSWLILDKTSGVTPSSINISLSDKIKKFRPGSYSASIVVDSGSVSGSPAAINVHLEVIEAGKIIVKTNLDEAEFSITGPESFSGSGKSWTAENAPKGTYTISFAHVSGYKKPDAKTFKVNTGKMAEIEGIYSKRPAATHIIAGSGAPDGNTVQVIPLDGGSGFLFSPFDESSGIKVAAGDMDGDGMEEIVVTNSKNIIKIYSAEGTAIAAYTLPGSTDNLEITMADIDRDGKSEIIAGYIMQEPKRTLISSLGLGNNKIRIEKTIMVKRGVEPFSLASGDINGCGYPELIVAYSSNISAYQTGARLKLIWSRNIQESVRPNITTGDINDDGVDEICLASGPDSNNAALVRFMNGDGTDYGLQINAFGDYGYKYGVTVSLADIAGDGGFRIAVGAGPGPANEALIRFFENDGEYINTIKALDTFYGVNVSFGKLAD
ncbi:MAG: FG-GAP-like repeat-containing protein [Nitrospirota bacterium]